jgi:hypothetical protein
MPIQPHWDIFRNIPHVPAGPVGHSPNHWVQLHELDISDNLPPLPNHQLTRLEVREICRNPDNPVLYGYICAMAWGLQGAGPGGRNHVTSAWAARDAINDRLHQLRHNNYSRVDSYSLFLGQNRIPGIGPAYFTKLLYFFSAGTNHYIMDQHTARSVNLLSGLNIVIFNGKAVSNINTPENYQTYCEFVDQIANLLNVAGDDVEEMLMSRGGHNPWPWRNYVRNFM